MSDQHMLSDRDRRDIQGLVLYGTTCPLLRYHFLRVSDGVGGRRLVRSLVDGESPLQVNTAALRDQETPSDTLVYVGFTWQGLQALAVSGVSLGSFPADFQEGATKRAPARGDSGDSAPERMLFDADAAHISVAIYARQRASLDTLSRQLLDLASTHGCGLVSMLDGEALNDSVLPSGQQITRPLHFGYSDDVAQPHVLAALDGPSGTPSDVPPGLFILGHPNTPQNGQPNAAARPMPIPEALAHNGTYGAFRMLEQDVDAYEEYLDRNASTPEARALLVRNMCEHWNPDVPLIRRSMPYGPPYDPTRRRDGTLRGLLELSFCASVKDQFESVMHREPSVESLSGEGGVAGTPGLGGSEVSGPVTASLAPFVTTRAAAYLFFPSVTGLRIISSLDEQPSVDSDRQATDEAVEVVVRAMMRAIGQGTARDAHPKHHGLVRATLEIDADVSESLRHGLFAAPGTYTAYIRYSNGRPTAPPPPDAAPDVRGMAVKLFGVDGDKEAPDEKRTHDFILASHPVFFVPDVLAYVDFLRLPSLDDKVRLFPELPKSFRSFENPLTIRYFSQTVYALGPLCVKYLVQPLDPAEQRPVPRTPEQLASRSPNCLREAMALHLAKRSATLALCVQLPPDATAAHVDDATRLWETAPIRVATITIPAQEFERPANDALAQTISFSPWHCLHDHRPLGSVNLARRRVYREASVLRHANGAASPREPDGIHDLD